MWASRILLEADQCSKNRNNDGDSMRRLVVEATAIYRQGGGYGTASLAGQSSRVAAPRRRGLFGVIDLQLNSAFCKAVRAEDYAGKQRIGCLPLSPRPRRYDLHIPNQQMRRRHPDHGTNQTQR